ncbi:MAG: hypothetical protein ACXW1S_09940 [Acidimicrobiia bacterium]
MSWNRERKADPALLVVQFSVCIVVWTVVLVLEGAVSRSGFIASVLTGLALTTITWLMIKLDLVRSPEKL